MADTVVQVNVWDGSTWVPVVTEGDSQLPISSSDSLVTLQDDGSGTFQIRTGPSGAQSTNVEVNATGDLIANKKIRTNEITTKLAVAGDTEIAIGANYLTVTEAQTPKALIGYVTYDRNTNDKDAGSSVQSRNGSLTAYAKTAPDTNYVALDLYEQSNIVNSSVSMQWNAAGGAFASPAAEIKSTRAPAGSNFSLTFSAMQGNSLQEYLKMEGGELTAVSIRAPDISGLLNEDASIALSTDLSIKTGGVDRLVVSNDQSTFSHPIQSTFVTVIDGGLNRALLGDTSYQRNTADTDAHASISARNGAMQAYVNTIADQDVVAIDIYEGVNNVGAGQSIQWNMAGGAFGSPASQILNKRLSGSNFALSFSSMVSNSLQEYLTLSGGQLTTYAGYAPTQTKSLTDKAYVDAEDTQIKEDLETEYLARGAADQVLQDNINAVVVVCTTLEYEQISPKNPTTLYCITD